MSSSSHASVTTASSPGTSTVTSVESKAPARSARSERFARLLNTVYAVSAIVAFAGWVTSPLHANRGFFWWEIVFGLFNLPVSHSLLSVVVLIVVASSLLKRKRAGLYAAMFFQLVGILYGILTIVSFQDFEYLASGLRPADLFLPALDLFGFVVGIVLTIFMWRARASYPARLERTSWTASLTALGAGIAATVLIMWFATKNLDSDVTWAILLRPLGIVTGWISAEDRHAAGFYINIASTLYALALIVAIYFFLRSPRNSNAWTQDNAVQVRSLIQDYGSNDSLSYFATRRDKSVIFSPDGRAAILYRVIKSTCLASGDPVGDPASWDAAIAAWKAEARQYGWAPAALSISEDGAAAYARAGLSITPMGDEAILVADRFSLNNTSMGEVRHAVLRVRKSGYTLQVRTQAELDKAELDELSSRASQWRHGEVERGFSMALNRESDPADAKVLIATAHAADGTMVGLLTFVPWGKTGVSLDLMRRSPDAPNGVVEFMVAELMEKAPELGIKQVSLNFAMFRSIFESAEKFGASPLTRLASSTLGILDRFLQLERLYRFNQKFMPEWLPRYMAYDSAFNLVGAALAAGIAEGFLPDWFTRKDRSQHIFDAEHLEQIREIERRRLVAEDVEPHRSDQTKHRIRHMQALRRAGMNPYPLGVEAQFDTVQIAQALASGKLPEGASAAKELTLAGRVYSIRHHGGVTFVTLIEGRSKVQVICEHAALGISYGLLTANLDSGDIAVFTGSLGSSRRGTPSFIADTWQIASKALHPIPFDHFTDPEARLRKRSTDLLVNPEQLENLRRRSAIISSIRRTLDGDGFTEVETPILNTVHGGASARPFKTFINAYGAELYLRIAPELYLKRLVVGGMGAVYELGRDFRNEGADATHNPEFTVLEAYKPYADYTTMRLLTESIVQNAARSVFGSAQLPLGKKNSTERTMTDISGSWPVRSVCEALSEAVGQTITLDTDFELLLQLARENQIHVRDDMGAGAVIEELYGELVEAHTVFPTFYTDFPVETSPLAGPHRSIAGLTERWDLVVNGMELGTAYSEMADALEQRRRLTEQSLKAAAGDPEAMEIDEDFLYALETGLPPTGGLGIGIDRLIMLMTQTQIRGVLTFPFVKPGS